MASLADLERAQGNKDNQVRISINVGANSSAGANVAIKAYATEDFTYALGNRFESLFESFGDQANKYASMASQLAASSGLDAKQFILRNLNQTVSQWVGSERFNFAMNLFFLALHPDDDVRVPIVALQTLALPTQARFGADALGALGGAAADFFNNQLGGGVLMAPNGYVANADSAFGTVAIRIGRWFQTPHLFVLRNINPMFSRAPLKSGLPLYAMCGCTFESYRLLTAQDVQAFYPGLSNNGRFYESPDSERLG